MEGRSRHQLRTQAAVYFITFGIDSFMRIATTGGPIRSVDKYRPIRESQEEEEEEEEQGWGQSVFVTFIKTSVGVYFGFPIHPERRQ